MRTDYVHGYTPAETRRLTDQAQTLADLLHGGINYEPGTRVLEAGCGVGAQTLQLLTRHPGIDLVSIDISEDSLAQAKARIEAMGRRDENPKAGGSGAADVRDGGARGGAEVRDGGARGGDSPGVSVVAGPPARVEFRCADLRELAGEEFDHVFVCFVLEHLADPVDALVRLRGLLRPGGSITVIEGDHQSAFFHPRSTAAQAVIECLVTLQAEAGGDALIGRRVQPLLQEAGFRDIRTEPRTVYADQTLPHLVDGFTHKTFIAMVESVRERALAAGLLTPQAWADGIRALERTAAPGGTFHYTFFRAEGRT